MGPLAGIRIVEFVGLGPGPFAAMLLSDMGAEVIRIDRKGTRTPHKGEIWCRGRAAVALDMKKPEAVEAALRLIEKADALIEGFRPGVMERLGAGPEVCLARNPRLVYGRMTGWGQHGPLAKAAGHDINYIALSGALHAIGRMGEKPVPPLNLVGDFGGGALYLAFGIVCGILEAQRSGKGQVVDAAMTDGSASLMTMTYGLKAMGLWKDERGSNMLDTGSHFYDTYETRDGKFVAIGSIEPQFYRVLLEKTGITDEAFAAQMDREAWPALKEKLAAVIKAKTRDEWDAIMLGSDVCYAPVLSLSEAPAHPHNVARGTFVEIDGVVQPAPAPRFSRTEPQVQGPPRAADNEAALAAWGFGLGEIKALADAGAI
ncbi:MAG: CoA transferase [Alphaproteobacteria bacterium]|nr:CoA transferase [Alphaproteobacteria bacterium]MDE2012574.1 CoA transferase [Alphaproteobacteria bacterium]MDE2073439.1 CoA transferase [Alphaproteobacteria bacterium]